MMYETVPEIKRSNIEHVVLYLKVLGIQDVLGFDYFEAPSEEQLVEVSDVHSLVGYGLAVLTLPLLVFVAL